MKYIMNFDINKVKELNKLGLAQYEIDRVENPKATRMILDSDDLLILRYLTNLSQAKGIVVDGEGYFWVKLQSMLDEFDSLILISKSALQKRLKKYELMGLISRYCKRDSNGSFSFIKIMDKLNDLIYIEPKKVEVIDEILGGDSEELPNKDGVKVSVDEENVSVEVGGDGIDSQIDEEKQLDQELRIEQIERVLKTKANRKLKSQLSRFSGNQMEFFSYFDKFIYPMIDNNEQHTCSYIIKNIKLYLEGEL